MSPLPPAPPFKDLITMITIIAILLEGFVHKYTQEYDFLYLLKLIGKLLSLSGSRGQLSLKENTHKKTTQPKNKATLLNTPSKNALMQFSTIRNPVRGLIPFDELNHTWVESLTLHSYRTHLVQSEPICAQFQSIKGILVQISYEDSFNKAGLNIVNFLQYG